MQFDISKLTPGQIAVVAAIATLSAAFVGGIFGLSVAWINGLMALRTARHNSRREFRTKLFSPFLETLTVEIVTIRSIQQTLSYANESQEYRDIDSETARSNLRKRADRVYPLAGHVPARSTLGKAMSAYTAAGDALDDQAGRIDELLLARELGPEDDWLSIPGAKEIRADYLNGLVTLEAVSFDLRGKIEAFIFE